jgi:hypothetical protein
LHQGPATEDDKDTDGVKAKPGEFEPGEAKDGYDPATEMTPIGWREDPVFELGAKEMKINHDQNREAFRHIEPKQAFHCRFG